MTWREQAERQRRAGYITARIIRHWTHRTSAAAFDSWFHVVRVGQKVSESFSGDDRSFVSCSRLGSCFDISRSRLLSRVVFSRWSEWVVFAAADSYIGHVTTCALAHFARIRRSSILGICVSTWRNFWEAAKYKQYLENLIFSQLNRSARSTKQSHFSAWSAVLEPDFESSGDSEDGPISDAEGSTLWGFDFAGQQRNVEEHDHSSSRADVIISTHPNAYQFPSQNGLSLL